MGEGVGFFCCCFLVFYGGCQGGCECERRIKVFCENSKSRVGPMVLLPLT